jgi:hypothetical protein
LALRVESLTVAPTHQPLIVVVAKNLQATPFEGTLAVKPPESWRLRSAEQQVRLDPGKTNRIAFMVEKGLGLEANRYAVEVSAVGAGQAVTHRQEIVCASAPYYKPVIDGKTDDWNDAIPVRFETSGKGTTIRTYWNRRAFSVLISVEEKQWIGPKEDRPFDAVQFAIAPENSATGTSEEDKAVRFEYLLVASGDGGEGKCYELASPGTELAVAAACRGLDGLGYDEAKVAVRRSEGVTNYECSIPFRPMRDLIRPSEGREFQLSVLVHDPDGTGIRDWGEAAGLWPWQRNALAWSRWQGAQWGDLPPFDSKTPWGLCSSKY